MPRKQIKPIDPHSESRLAHAIRVYISRHNLTYNEFAGLVSRVRWQCARCCDAHVTQWLQGAMPDAFYFTAIMQVIGCTDPNELFDPPPSEMYIEYKVKPRF